MLLAGLMGLCLPLTRWLPAAASQSHTQQASAGTNGFSLRAALGILAVLAFYVGLGAVWTFIGGIASQAGLSANESGDILAVASLLGIAGSGCASLLGERRGRGRAPLLLAGYTMMLAATLLLLGQPQLARFATAALLLKFSWTFALPYILASLATLDPSGRLMTATNLVIGGGLAIGPAIAGRLLEASGGAFHSVLLGAAACTALSLGLILSINRRQPA
jgi:predicted MFS family arabinose efflux permease